MSSEETKAPDKATKAIDKAPFIIYADPGCITEKIDGCKNNPEILLQQK